MVELIALTVISENFGQFLVGAMLTSFGICLQRQSAFLRPQPEQPLPFVG